MRMRLMIRDQLGLERVWDFGEILLKTGELRTDASVRKFPRVKGVVRNQRREQLAQLIKLMRLNCRTIWRSVGHGVVISRPPPRLQREPLAP
jgi:hypothetical protein